ncbi:MAG TPA: ABC transporter substrate-binding protein [Trueperaceae bacterium]|nr:ABC transporter substrate-binding protein [Trueperaceae bacterium]
MSFGNASRRQGWAFRGILAALLLALVSVGAAQTVVTIGFSLPLTGGAAKEGTESKVGAELAAQVINDAGGFKVGDQTVTLKLVFEDDLCSPQGAIDAASRLAVAGATFVGGSFCSSAALAEMPVLAALGIPQIAYAYADELTTTARADANAVLSARLGVQARNEMVPLAKYAVLENGDKTFFAMAQNTDFGRSMIKHFKATVEALGGSLVAEPEYFAYAATDFRTLLTKAKASGADAIVGIGLAQEMIGILLQSDELGITQTLYGSDLVSDVSVVSAVGQQNVEGVYFPWYDDTGTAARTFDRTAIEPGVQALLDAGERILGITPGRNHGLGWGTVMLIKQAMERAGTTDPAATMQQVLSGQDFELSYGNYHFLQCGQAVLGAGVATFDSDGLLLVADRDYAFVEPVLLTEADLCN